MTTEVLIDEAAAEYARKQQLRESAAMKGAA